MVLVLIYGPPAVGKLSVGKQLQILTGYKLLENHLIVDSIGAIFGFGNPTARHFNVLMRNILYRAAIKHNVPGLITTFCYYGNAESKSAIRKAVTLVRKSGGKVLCVKLSCEKQELEKRVESFSRRNTYKIHNLRKFRKLIQNEWLNRIIPESICKSLWIDNTKLSPKKTALLIRRKILAL